MRPSLLAILALLAPLAALGQENPITNGGFEAVGPAGAPLDWQILGSGRVETGEAHSGERALRLTRAADTEGEVGLNRDWAPDTGQGGAMLPQTKGGIRFWYRALSADPGASLTVQVIPMDARPLEVGGGRAIWSAPASHVGDGLWHEGALAYDFSSNPAIRWVHVAARLNGGAADLLLDDFAWVAEVGPVLQCDGIRLTESPGKEGLEAELRLSVRNAGDAPLPPGEARVKAPAGLTVSPDVVALAELGPGGKGEARFLLRGRRTRAGQALVGEARAGDQRAEAQRALVSALTPVALRCAAFVALAGSPVGVELLAENRGDVFESAPEAVLTAPAGARVTPAKAGEEVAPGTTGAIASWQVTLPEPAPLAVLSASVRGGAASFSARLVAARALPTEAAIPREECILYAGDSRAYAGHRANGEAFVGSDKVRLVLAPVAEGALIGSLQVPADGGWRTVAQLPYLGLLATPESEAALPANGTVSVAARGGAELTLTGALEAQGARWRLRWTFHVATSGDMVHYTLEARPSADAQVLALEGPMLYSERDARTPREDAILPGLEWLVRGEESSNALDILPDHPDRIREVPHPRKVTIPACGFRTGDTVVGLLWDTPPEQAARRPAYGADAGPASIVFASPDRLGGHAGDLAGLLLPAVGDWMPENGRRAKRPFPLDAERALRIEADLLTVTGAKDSLVALDRWFALHPYPAPLDYPRGTLEAEVAFSLGGYAKDRALWDAQAAAWHSDLIVNPAPTKAPALELLRGAELLGEGEASTAARALAAEALGGDERSRALALQHRADPAGLIGFARGARGLIATQGEDGNWPFGGPKAGTEPKGGVDYDMLGPAGATEVGLTAPNASVVLELAMLTGDPEALRSGLKALEAMRRFRVPRAAQVWEVPVHTPDILASARAVNAYLLGYKLTGDRARLADAVYWARTGLPFVYVWSAPDMPAMQGASIPVFGATAYVLSWFGVAVQWNGIAYAEELVELARYDDSFPWARVAENVYRSAMRQQATEGDRLAQWPDAHNLVGSRPGLYGQTPPCFQPSAILRALFRSHGLHPGLRTAVVRQKEEQLAVRAAAEITEARWEGDRLRVGLRFGPGEMGAAEIVGAARPASVQLDGQDLAESADLWAADAPGWQWHETAADLEVRITAPGEHAIVVQGVRRVPLELAPPTRTTVDFAFARGLDGWYAANQLTPPAFGPEGLTATTTGADPYLTRDSLSVAGEKGDVLVIRMALSGGGAGSVFWGTAASPALAPARELPLPCPADGQLHDVRVPVGAHAEWAGQRITSLRIDPGSGEAGVAVRIESVRVERAGRAG